jgi:hypothetical protein
MQELIFIFQRKYSKDMTFLDFLKKRGDPLCLARLRFYEFVSTSEFIDHVKLLEIASQLCNQYALERIAISLSVIKF